MVHGFLHTLVKITIASLIVGSIMGYFGVTPERMLLQAGLTPERLSELLNQAAAWALPNLILGAMVIVPVWFLIFLFRPPRPRSD
jgi:Domain of unknown function (DUF6460)